MWFTCHHQVSVTFNYIYAVGLIVSILSHFESVLCETVHIDSAFHSGVHTMLMYWYCCCWLCQECGQASFFSCVFSQYFHSIAMAYGVVLFSIELCGFPSCFWHMWTIMMEIDYPAIRFQYFVLFSVVSDFAILVLLSLDDHGVT